MDTGVMTLEQYNQHWINQTSGASSVEQLSRMLSEAKRSEHWNGKLAKHACHILVLLSGPRDTRYRTLPGRTTR